MIKNDDTKYLKSHECIWCDSNDVNNKVMYEPFVWKGITYQDCPMYFTQCNVCDGDGVLCYAHEVKFSIFKNVFKSLIYWIPVLESNIKSDALVKKI